MNASRTRILLWALAFAMFIAGGIVWLRTTARLGQLSASMSRRIGEHAKLSAMKTEHLAMEQAWRAESRKATTTVPTPMDAAGALLGGIKPLTQNEQRTDLMGSWRLRRQELTFSEIPLIRLTAFVRALETNTPPWRLAQIDMTSSHKTGTAERVKMILEAVEPARPGNSEATRSAAPTAQPESAATPRRSP
jgi:hypothetical protein